MFFLAALGMSVNRADYSTLEQVDYANRARFTKGKKWTADIDSANVFENYFSLKIKDEDEKHDLVLNISFLKSGNVRIRMQPKEEPNFERYDVSKENLIILQSVIANTSTIEKSKSDDFVIVKSNDYSVKITKELKIVVSKNDTVITTLNADAGAIYHFNNDPTDNMIHGFTDIAMSFNFDNGVRFTGVPSHTLPLTIPDTVNREKVLSDPIRLFNTDINSFEVGNGMAMYGGIPYLIAHKGPISTTVMWLNAAETWIDIDSSESKARFMSESGFIDILVASGTHKEAIKSYVSVTGAPVLQPIFALGFHQCRWTYMSTNELREVSQKLDEIKIPHDVLWLDLDHADDKKYFTFGHSGYSDITAYQKELNTAKRRLVCLIDPHLKAIDSYRVFKEAKDNNFLVKNGSDEPMYLDCWPGRSAWVDFFDPEARKWWAQQYNYTLYKKSSNMLFAWNDMNEPAIFNGPDKTAPRDSRHFGGHEERELHNAYGHMMVSASYDGLVERNRRKSDRPFILTRSYFAGTQRFAVMWTGDNAATWEMLKNSVQMTLTLGVCGMPYSGSDVGGFFNSPDADLLLRWYQLGAWAYPFFRCHCHHLADHREVYTLPEAYQKIAKAAIDERYELLPLWYTLAKECEESGMPIVRPMYFEFSDDTEFSDIDDQFMIGNSLLVAPLLIKDKNSRIVKFPNGRWYSYRSLKELKISEKEVTIRDAHEAVPVFARGGTVFARRPVWRSSSLKMVDDPFDLVICADSEGKAEGRLYQDDGRTFDYQRGEYLDKKITFDGHKIVYSGICGLYDEYKATISKIKVAGVEKPSSVSLSGSELHFEYSNGVITIDANASAATDWEIVIAYGSSDL